MKRGVVLHATPVADLPRPVRRRWRLPPWLVLLAAVLLGAALLARAVAT